MSLVSTAFTYNILLLYSMPSKELGDHITLQIHFLSDTKQRLVLYPLFCLPYAIHSTTCCLTLHTLPFISSRPVLNFPSPLTS